MSDELVVSRDRAVIEAYAQAMAEEEGLDGRFIPDAGAFPDNARPLPGRLGYIELRVKVDGSSSLGSPSELLRRVLVLGSPDPYFIRGRVVYGDIPVSVAVLAREVKLLKGNALETYRIFTEEQMVAVCQRVADDARGYAG